MDRTQLNMIDLMNEAWEDRFNYDSDTYQEYCKNLFSHAYVKIRNGFAEYCAQNNLDSQNYVDTLFNVVIIAFMIIDGDFNEEEYSAYATFCNYAEITPYSYEECLAILAALTPELVVQSIQMLVGTRDIVGAEDWQSLVLGFCYLCLMGDKEMDENEYYLLSCFFEDGYDYKPESWDAFKAEWV